MRYLEKYPIKARLILLALFIVLMVAGAQVESNLLKIIFFIPAVFVGTLSQLDNKTIKYLLRIK